MDEVFESVARYFAILSEPARLRILHAICQEERSVGQIVEETELSQSNASRHLNLMYQAGVIKRRREGSQVLYAVTDTSLTDICRAVCVRVSAQLGGTDGLKKGVNELIDELR
ncbi:MAG: metalloregulator ArsR/SmtB family transcription factor [Caldimonas sp.]